MKKVKKMLLIGLIDAITTQIFFDVFSSNFRISLAVAILPVFYYFDRELNPLITSFFVASIGLIFRTILSINTGLIFSELLVGDFPILFFDLTYGLLFYFIFYKSKDMDIAKWLYLVYFADVISNSVELIMRGESISEYLNVLIIVAFIRMIISLLIVLIIYYYNKVYRDEIDKKRYYDLLSIFADIKSEVYLMNKNINYIENTMTDAYMLYNDFDDKTIEDKKMKALSIAKNIHEIKKNYISILKGLDVLNFKKENYNQMNLIKLLNILKENISKNINESIHLKIHVGEDLVINKHYYLMSILRNLINNSVDAILKKEKEQGIIDIRYYIEEENLIIEVFDNGGGIKEKYINYIFNSGYSSKFTKKGEIHRGLGLTLVKEIIENEFNGSIEVESIYEKYTLFKITLDIKSLEGGTNEILYIR